MELIDLIRVTCWKQPAPKQPKPAAPDIEPEVEQQPGAEYAASPRKLSLKPKAQQS